VRLCGRRHVEVEWQRVALEGREAALRRKRHALPVADAADARVDFGRLVRDRAHDAAGEWERRVQEDGADAAADLVHGRGPGAGSLVHDEMLHCGGRTKADHEALGFKQAEIGSAEVSICEGLGEDVHAGLGRGLHGCASDHGLQGTG
jgi:hypothetical protein